MGSVFISHSWNDKPLARKLAETLKLYEISVWLDEAEIKLGDSLIEKIRAGIDSVDFVIALLSQSSVSSEWVKRELDIAMNQEIEGKRVKVLPILAAQCTLPGFLKGKLYADMSTGAKFRKSLPLLLRRLNVPPSVLETFHKGKAIQKITKASKEALDLLSKLETHDTKMQYQALKSIQRYQHKDLISHPRMIDAISSRLNSTSPQHVRLEALRVFGSLEDPNFASRVSSLLDDVDEVISSRAIDILAELKAAEEGAMLISALSESKSLRKQKAVLRFLAAVSLTDDSEALSAVDATLKWAGSHLDVGSNVLVARVLCRQWSGARDEILERMLRFLESGPPEVRLALLTGLVENIDEGYIRRLEVREQLSNHLQRLMQSDVDTEMALAWLAALLWYEFPRVQLWENILSARPSGIAAFFRELDIQGYNLRAIFDKPQDQDALLSLSDCTSGALREAALGAFAEAATGEKLIELHRRAYRPSGWKITSVLEGMATITAWSQELKDFLELLESHLESDNQRARALVLLCRFHANDLRVSDLLRDFPKNGVLSSHRRFDIKRDLKVIQSKASPEEKRAIARLIRNLEESQESWE